MIDGKVAVSFWPDGTAGNSGCTAHLVPDRDHDGEIVYRCGRWLRPLPGKYKFWLETPGKISPSSSVFSYAGGAFQGRGMVLRKALVAAGRVALGPDGNPPPDAVLRLLHLDSHLRDAQAGRELSRRAQIEDARAGVQMPEGEIVAALYDNASGEYLGVSLPVTVASGDTTFIDPRLPAEGSDLIVRLERPDFVTDVRKFDVELTVEGVEGEPRSPEVLIPAPDRIYAVWYGLRGKYARLVVSSRKLSMPSADIPLRPRHVESFAGGLRPLPQLDVTLDLPPGFESERLALVVVSEDGYEETLRRIDLPLDARRQEIDALPTKPVQVVLEAPPWEFEQAVDLSDGFDKSLVFRPEPIHVDGTVYRGDRKHPAILTFQTTRVRDETGFITVETDEEGFYQTTFFRPWFYHVAVQVEGPEGPRFMEMVKIREDRTLDFHLPANRYRVRVLDLRTGDGVPEATVNYLSRSHEGVGSGTAVSTDEEGVADLPPLRPGKLEFGVSAEGYFPARDQEVPIEDAGARVFTVTLRPLGETDALQVLLPLGQAAREARVAVLSPAAARAPEGVWSSVADPEGRVSVPESLVGRTLVVLHPQAGFLIRRWQPTDASETVWILPEQAPPLVVQAVRPSGGPIRAAIGLIVEGHRLAGGVLVALTRSKTNGTNRDGVWTGSNLPAVPLTVCAWTDGHSELAFHDGLLDALAVPVAYPWPQPVEVPVAD